MSNVYTYSACHWLSFRNTQRLAWIMAVAKLTYIIQRLRSVLGRPMYRKPWQEWLRRP